MSSEKQTAVLLLAHGSRRQEANDDLCKLADMLKAENRYAIVEYAYLELAPPSIPEGAVKCVEQGAERVLMMPWFLSAGRHVAEDLEAFRQEFEQTYPDVEFKVCQPLGLHPAMIDIVLDRLKEE